MKNHKPAAGKGGGSSHNKGGAASSSARKSRWEPDKPSPRDRPSSVDPKLSKDAPSISPAAPGPSAPSPAAHLPRPGGSPFPAPEPPPPPPYGFHNLERRTIVLADGSVRSYFALPPDYDLRSHPEPAPFPFPFDRPRFPPPPGGPRFTPDDSPPPHFRRGFDEPLRPGGHDYWASLGLDRGPLMEPGGPSSSLKRKHGERGEDEEDELAWHRRHVLQYGGNPRDDPRLPKLAKLERDGYDDLPPAAAAPPRRGRHEDGSLPPAVQDVDPQVLKKAFLKFSKVINENPIQRKNYLEDGHNGPLQCIVCGRASKDFADGHGLIMHAYNSQNPDLRVDHLGLHKALCVLMGWNYMKAPENSKAYHSLSADDAAANRDDLIIWPPTVIIHNTNSGRRKDGRMEGMGNKEMDIKLKELGFGGGKSKSMYGKEGHLGTTVVKFANTQAGLKEAERLAEYFEKDNHGRRGWSRAQASQAGDDDEKNPALVKVDEKTGEKKRIFYGYLATASDLDKVDFDMRKRAIVKSKKEIDLSD